MPRSDGSAAFFMYNLPKCAQNNSKIKYFGRHIYNEEKRSGALVGYGCAE